MTIFRWKLIRWKYVAPRLALVILVALLFRFGLDPLLKWAIVAGGESALGAKVELVGGRHPTARRPDRAQPVWLSPIPIRRCAIFMQADRAHLYLDTDALLHKRLVIRDGNLSGLQFDTDRETSGELAETPET